MKILTLISAVITVAVVAFFHNNCVFAQGNGKIEVCHYTPGNPDNPQTITISVNALDAHLAHGDYIGACNENEIKTVELLKLNASPNPYSGQLNIVYDLLKESLVRIEVYNQFGIKIHTIVNGTNQAGKFSLNFSAKSLGYSSGIYLLRAVALSDAEYIELSMIIVEIEY
ncbi:MAG: T9SS type A sorting domain-containing protein [Bacteroidales bacterium]